MTNALLSIMVLCHMYHSVRMEGSSAPKLMKSFCAEFKGKSAKEVLSLCLTERDYWKPTGRVIDYRTRIRCVAEYPLHEIDGEMSQLEDIEQPIHIRFVKASGAK